MYNLSSKQLSITQILCVLARLPAKARNTAGENSSVVTSDLDTTSFLDSEDDRGTR